MNDHSVTRRGFLQASTLSVGASLLASRARLQAAAPLRFGLVTDIHYADIEPAGIKTYRESTAKLADCVRFMNEQKVDFLAELGDFKDQGKPPDEAVTLRFLEAIDKVFKGFAGPRYHVLGNHDADSLSKRQFLSAVGLPSRPSYFSFDTKGVTFVVLDGNFRSDGADYDHGNYAWEDSNVPAVELTWLQGALGRAPGPVIVFIHQRLDGEGGGYFVKNAPAVRAALEGSKKVAAVFQGHQHEGGYSLINGIHYYTLKALVDGTGPEGSAYAIVEVDAGMNLTVAGYRRAESRKLARG
jgi:predicted phosphodiesterase